MLSEDLRTAHNALGMVLSRTDPEGAAVLRLIRRNFEDYIDQAVHYETRLLVPCGGVPNETEGLAYAGDALRKVFRPPLLGETIHSRS